MKQDRKPSWTPASTAGAALGTVALMPLAMVVGIVLLFNVHLAIVVALIAAVAWGIHKGQAQGG